MPKHPGPSKFRKRPKTFAQEIKILAHIQGKEIMPDVKLYRPRKARGPDKGPRDQPERRLRAEVIKYLRRKGCHVLRMENGVCGKLGRGVPDLMFFTAAVGFNCYPQSRFYFIELKSEKGFLLPEQKSFQDLCEKSGTGYILARSLEDIKERVG